MSTFMIVWLVFVWVVLLVFSLELLASCEPVFRHVARRRFQRTFGCRSDFNVEWELTRHRIALEEAFRTRAAAKEDSARICGWAKEQEALREAQHKFDVLMGVALLNGYGKIVTRVTRKRIIK